MSNKRFAPALFAILLAGLVAGCDASTVVPPPPAPNNAPVDTSPPVNLDWKATGLPFGLRLSAAAEERARHRVAYDAAYVRIPYPNGDVAADKGVCSDEVIRAYRLLDIDLQQLVHEDMVRAFHAYPRRWGLSRPDSNIDHRRVPNLATFFTRHGRSLPVSTRGRDYAPGEVVTFALADGRPHVGIVTERLSRDGARPLVLHNIGWGPQIEDMLFTLTITGRYRYEGPAVAAAKGLGAPRATR